MERILTRAALIILLGGSAAYADCGAPGRTFLSCTMEGSGKLLEVCIAGDQVTYAFGPAGAPELSLSAPVATVEYHPWPGVSRTIYEQVAFEHQGYVYTVFGGIERGYDSSDDEIEVSQFGGVMVTEGRHTPVAHLDCAPGQVTFGWTNALSEAKARAGLQWDMESRSWVSVQ